MELRDLPGTTWSRRCLLIGRDGGGNPLVEAPTGPAKALAIADLTPAFALQKPTILNLSHSATSLNKTRRHCCALWPDMPVDMFGINSAALNRRDTETQILLATVPTGASQAPRLCRPAQQDCRRDLAVSGR